MNRKKVIYIIISISSILLFILVWYVSTVTLKLFKPNTLPNPLKVFTTFIDKLTNSNPDGGTLIEHTLSSMKVMLSGYIMAIIIGVPLGICMAWYKSLDRFVRPIFDLLKPIPGVAWIPLMIVLLGIGMQSKAIVIFISAVVPVLLNSYTGVKQTTDVHLWVARTFGATNTQKLIKLAIPTAVPYIMTGIRIGLGSAWGTIVAAELLASSKGLGFMIQQSRGIYRTDIIIVGMISIGICGALLSQILMQIEKRVMKGRV